MEQSTITKKWQQLSKRVMLIGFAVAIVVCIIMFVILGVSMNNNSNDTINGVGEMFMEGVGRQSAMRYDQVIDQRLTTVDGLTWGTGDQDLDDASIGMAGEAKMFGFTYLAYLKPDGTFKEIYYARDEANNSTANGTVRSIKLRDHESFVKDLKAGKNKVDVAEGMNKENPDDPSATVVDEGVILFGVPTGRTDYTAIIAGIKNDDIVAMLAEKNTNGSNAERFNTHIIRADGSFVMYGNTDEQTIKPADYTEFLRTTLKVSNADSVWTSMQSELERITTEKNQAASADTYIRPYSKVLYTSVGHKHVYCQKLANSEWFLVSVMDYADIDNSVNGLSKNLTAYMIVACVIIIVLMSALFVAYFLMNRTNLKQVEEARAAAEEANKAKSDFLSNMSHDVRTPMNAIMGMTTVAIANIDDKQQVSYCLKKISLSSRHLLGLINDVLDMSKIAGGNLPLNMEQIVLGEVVEGSTTIIQPHLKSKRQKFDVSVRDIITENVYCDSVRLNQMLSNLLSNAYKFTPEEGEISLSIYQEQSPRGDDYIRTHIEVADNGIGMSEEFQKHLFDSFTREDRARVDKAEGTGLGMAITKYIIDAMQGSIEVNSKQGEGTTFHVILDLERVEIHDSAMSLPDWKILVIDDDEELRETTVATLAVMGAKAEAVPAGAAAIKTAVDAFEANQGYDVILTGWKMAEIDGVETAKRLRKQLGKDVPIILFSAYDYSDIEEDARSAGISGFICKPLFKSSLYYGLNQFADVADPNAEHEQHGRKYVDLKGKRVLVAEDNDLNWEIADLLLTSAGIIVERAENGQTCVDKLLAHKVDYYDAILMDVRMPVMNGLEATTVIRSLKRGYNKVPIIAMTADAFTEDVQKCLSCGMNAHIAKPIDIEIVKATLAKYIKR